MSFWGDVYSRPFGFAELSCKLIRRLAGHSARVLPRLEFSIAKIRFQVSAARCNSCIGITIDGCCGY